MTCEDSKKTKIKHDPTLCLEHSENAECNCPCERCQAYRYQELRRKRRLDLVEKLRKDGIHPTDLADIVWTHLEPVIEARIEKMILLSIKRYVRGMKLWFPE